MAWADEVAAMNADVLAEFGESVSYERSSSEPFAIRAIWTEQTGATTAWCLLSDFPLLPSGERMQPAPGDRITKDGHAYKVSDKPALDGAGAATLTLRMMGAA